MAKKSTKSDRQAVIDEIRKKQKGAEQRRGFAIVGVCSVVALLIVVAAAYRPVKNWWDLRKFNDIDLASIGAPASVCGKVTTKKADGNQQHVPTGTQVVYDDAPAGVRLALERGRASPRRRSTGSSTPTRTARSSRRWCTTSSTATRSSGTTRPIADDADQLNVIDGIADKFRADSDNLRFKFIAAPWTSADEKESGKFPDGEHIAFSHWSAGGAGETDTTKQVGVFQYCSAAERRGAEDLHARRTPTPTRPSRTRCDGGARAHRHRQRLLQPDPHRPPADDQGRPRAGPAPGRDRQQRPAAAAQEGPHPHDRGRPARDRGRAALRRRGRASPSTTTRPWSPRCASVRELHPDAELLFCNGGDRSHAGDPVPSAETHLTEEIGLQMVYGVGGEDKADSSSRINEELSRSDIPTGPQS